MTSVHTAPASPTSASRRIDAYYPPPDISLVTPWTIDVFDATHFVSRRGSHRQAAERNFAKRGLEAIGKSHSSADDHHQTLIAEATRDGVIIGGVCVYLADASGRLPILDWLEGHVDTTLLRARIASLMSDKVVHCAGFWTDPDYRSNGLAGDLARALLVMMTALEVRYSVITCHQYTLEPLDPLGWHRLHDIPAFPYPDQRYTSYVILNDAHAWKPDIARWAAQGTGATLLGPNARLVIHPMRAARELVMQ